MKRNFIKVLAGLVMAAFVAVLSTADVKAYDPNRILKYDATVTDASWQAFGSAYDRYIPAALKAAFESEGGLVYVLPHNVVDARVDLSGWAGGSLNNVTGYMDPNGGFPKVFLNSKVVDRAGNYHPGTYEKVIVHEFGHYACLEANKIRTGRYSYTFSPQMQAAFQTEYTGYTKTPGMSAVFAETFRRNTSLSEFYANVFAAMILDPANAQIAFPNACAAIAEDMAVINNRFMPQVQQQNQAQALQAQQAAQLAAAQQQALAAQAALEAQAVQILQAQASQAADPALAAAAKQQLALYYALKQQK